MKDDDVPYHFVQVAENLTIHVVSRPRDKVLASFVDQSFTNSLRKRGYFLGSAKDIEVRFTVSTTTVEPRLAFTPVGTRSLIDSTFYEEVIPGCLMNFSANALCAHPILRIRVPLLSLDNDRRSPARPSWHPSSRSNQ